MAKIISKNTKANRLRANKRLDKEVIALKLPGLEQESLPAKQALALANRLFLDGNTALALNISEKLYAKLPDVIDIHLLKIKCLLDMESLVEANELISNLLASASDNFGVLFATARLKVLLGDVVSAIKYFKAAIKMEPNYLPAQISLAEFYQAIGEPKKSAAIYRRIMDKSQGKKSADKKLDYLAALVNLGAVSELEQKQLDELQTVYGQGICSLPQQSQMAYVLSGNYAKKKVLDKEVNFLNQANHFLARSLNHVMTVDEFINDQAQHYELMASIFDSKKPEFLREFKSSSKLQPIFILGMPRSGTTLMEQMLSTHDFVGQTGESSAFMTGLDQVYKEYLYINDVSVNFPYGLNTLPSAALESIVDYYERHQQLLTDKNIFIDKHLASYRYAGLAAFLFPKAKFVHMSRSPMDIFLSCYKNAIPGVPATCNLEHMAVLYIYMKKIIGLWKRVMPDQLHIVDYAELVNDPEVNLKKLLDFLGLEFDESMLEFHTRKNVVRTLSVDQVRQPIYKTSVKKWLPYADMLEPARKVLRSYDVSEDGVSFLS